MIHVGRLWCNNGHDTISWVPRNDDEMPCWVCGGEGIKSQFDAGGTVTMRMSAPGDEAVIQRYHHERWP